MNKNCDCEIIVRKKEELIKICDDCNRKLKNRHKREQKEILAFEEMLKENPSLMFN